MATRILVVDDEAMILTALERELEEWIAQTGLIFESADSVDKALEKVAKAPDEYAVVISDLKMPRRKGTELLLELQNRYANISTILLTGFSEMDEIKSAIKSGIIAFIQKPWDSDFLVAELKRGLELRNLKVDRQRYVDQLEHEISFAKRINQVLLLPELRSVKGIELGLAYKPVAKSSCGGDFFQIIPWSKDELLVCLGDVELHGVEGTYFALLVRDQLKAILADLPSGHAVNPATILELLNNRIIALQVNLPSVIMPMSVLSIRRTEKKIVYACAGGEQFFVFRKAMAERHHLPSPGLGYQKDVLFVTRTIAIEEGDRIILASNGAELGDSIDQEHVAASLAKILEESATMQMAADRLLEQFESLRPSGFVDDASLIALSIEDLA